MGGGVGGYINMMECAMNGAFGGNVGGAFGGNMSGMGSAINGNTSDI